MENSELRLMLSLFNNYRMYRSYVEQLVLLVQKKNKQFILFPSRNLTAAQHITTKMVDQFVILKKMISEWAKDKITLKRCLKNPTVYFERFPLLEGRFLIKYPSSTTFDLESFGVMHQKYTMRDYTFCTMDIMDQEIDQLNNKGFSIYPSPSVLISICQDERKKITIIKVFKFTNK